jgi:dGTPase
MDDWYQRREPRPRRLEDSRSETQIDHARIIHSASFRRLQGKTQILNLGDSDFYRTRLTHSLEVAQVAGGLVQHLAATGAGQPWAGLLPDTDLVQAMGLTHDLGHPPFGHGGEAALNYCMRDAGGFEGNGQTLRILGRLERYSASHGANLTRRLLLGVLKYPVPFSRAANPERRPHLSAAGSVVPLIDREASKPPKCYLDCDQGIVDWIFAPLSPADREAFATADPIVGKHAKARHKALDCSVMDLADDIGFGVHDLEDAIALGLFTREAFCRHLPIDTCASLIARLDRLQSGRAADHYAGLVDDLFGAEEANRKGAIGLLVNHFISEAVIRTVDGLEAPLLRHRAALHPAARAMLDAMILAVRAQVIDSAAVQQLEFKGQMMVVAVFEAIASDPRHLLPEAPRALHAEAADDAARLRAICDYIASMTDASLLKIYQRLFSPNMGSIFDRS